MDDISRQAARRGIETEYVDAGGVRRVVDPFAIARLIEAIPPHRNAYRRIFAPTAVVRHGSKAHIKAARRYRGSIRWDVYTYEREAERIAGGESATADIALPLDLPVGTFDLRINFLSPQREGESITLLVAPERAYQGDDDRVRMWVLAVQLYGVRSYRNWGHGDFTDLATLIDRAAELGAAGIGLNPLHDTSDASPYSPNSRLFLNPLYIDIEAIPAFPGITAETDRDVDRLRRLDLVDYPAVRRAKLRELQRVYEAFGTKGTTPISATLRDFVRSAARRCSSLPVSKCCGKGSSSPGGHGLTRGAARATGTSTGCNARKPTG